MKKLPDTAYAERRFTAFCCTVLKNDVKNIKKRLNSNAIKAFPLNPKYRDITFADGLDEYVINSVPFIIDGTEIIVADYDLALAISKLTKKRQEVILLSYFIGLNDKEIALRKGVTRQNIHELRHNAIKQIKEYYKEIIRNE